MKVAAINDAGDWTFGLGLAGYKSGSDAIAQNVITRLRCFTNDCFLDVDNGIDWITLLGSRNEERRIKRAVERTVLQTDGVMSVSKITLSNEKSTRHATIHVEYTDVYGKLANQILVTQ